jgi:hypothetical protein
MVNLVFKIYIFSYHKFALIHRILLTAFYVRRSVEPSFHKQQSKTITSLWHHPQLQTDNHLSEYFNADRNKPTRSLNCKTRCPVHFLHLCGKIRASHKILTGTNDSTKFLSLIFLEQPWSSKPRTS